jgi:hypothetical protein
MDQPPNLPHGGTRPKPPTELRSPVLRDFGAAIAKACVEQIYATWPDLLDRYGERGRQFTAEDNFWHLNFLDAAVALGDPEHFRRYATWLLEFFAPRGLGPEHVAGAFQFLAEGLAAAEVPPEQEGHRQELIEVLRDTGARIRALPLETGSGAPRPDEGSPEH